PPAPPLPPPPPPPRRPFPEHIGREHAELLGERLERRRHRRPVFHAEVPPQRRELVRVLEGRPADRPDHVTAAGSRVRTITSYGRARRRPLPGPRRAARRCGRDRS